MFWIALAILAVAIPLWGALRAAAAAEEEFPVWWSHRLELNKLEDLPIRLPKALEPERWRFAAAPEDRDKTIEDCFWYLETWRSRGLYAELTRCNALRLLTQVRAAEESHLRTFKLGLQALNILPNLFFDYALGRGDVDDSI